MHSKAHKGTYSLNPNLKYRAIIPNAFYLVNTYSEFRERSPWKASGASSEI